jgi:uncharacterized protein YyaL (SSP411 family)
LTASPNFEDEHWHLRVAVPLDEVAQSLNLPVSQCRALLDAARGKLLQARAKRVWPGRDDKILVSWNALMIRGMARAAGLFDKPAWLDSARRATDFVRSVMWRDGRLFATYKDGRAHLNAYLDDYAFMLDALLELMQADFRPQDAAFARELADCLLEQFEDQENGGFFFTSHDHEQLIQRTKTGYDNATPSGNGVAAFALQRLGHLLGESRYLEAAARTLRLFFPTLQQHPGACVSLLLALEEALVPPCILILRGDSAQARQWQRELSARFRPHTMVLTLPGDLAGLPPLLDKPAPAAGVNAWLCQGVSCLPLITDLGTIARQLDAAV